MLIGGEQKRHWPFIKRQRLTYRLGKGRVASNEKKKKALFGECKWRENVDAYKLLKSMQEKAAKFGNENRNVRYAVFAKSFKNRPDSCECIDLKDIEKMLSK